MSNFEEDYIKYGVRPDVLNFDDVKKMVPALAGHRKLVETILHWLYIDHVNEVHGRWCRTPGAEFSHKLVNDEFHVRMRVDNPEILASFPGESFLTVSNHPLGGFDGIALIDLVTRYRPDYKVMVNMFLNHLSAMRPTFIAVDPTASTDPAKRKASLEGIREVMRRVKEGHPVGFFPAGAVSKLGPNLRLRDRQWQPAVVRLISQLRRPVVPIYFHNSNSHFFNFLGLIDWRLRTLRLPREVFNKANKELHISVGTPVSVEEQTQCADLDALSALLRERTYALAKLK